MEPRILVTLGPASLTEKVVRECSDLGTYLFRINLSHTPIELLAETIQKIQYIHISNSNSDLFHNVIFGCCILSISQFFFQFMHLISYLFSSEYHLAS